jgi:PD-(D/E)XK nuclease superfamily
MQTLILDSSQIAAHESCPTEWSNRGLIQINKANPAETLRPGDPLAAGSLGHKYLEIYYSELAISGDSTAAAKQALAFDPDEADKVDKQFPLDLALREKVRNRVIDYFTMYGGLGRDYKPGSRSTIQVGVQKICRLCGLIRKNGNSLPPNGCLHEVVEQLCDIPTKDPLIEKGFSYKLFENRDFLFVLEGRIDFMGTAPDGTVLWMDHKFQFREHTLYSKSIQFRNYALATGLNLAVINYIRLHEKITKQTFVRQPLSFSSLEMRHWKEELIGIYMRIAREVREGVFLQNRQSCSGSWGRPCQFTPLCEEYNPVIREAIRKRDFTTKKEWRPW